MNGTKEKLLKKTNKINEQKEEILKNISDIKQEKVDNSNQQNNFAENLSAGLASITSLLIPLISLLGLIFVGFWIRNV